MSLLEPFIFYLFIFIWLDDPHLTYKHSEQADEGNYAYCQSSGAYNIKHNLWKLALRGYLNTDSQARDATRTFLLTRTMPQATALQTLMTEAEAMVNSRPLATAILSDPECPIPFH